LPWFTEPALFAPLDLHPFADQCLVGSVAAVAGVQSWKPEVNQLFHWDERFALCNDAIKQLQLIIASGKHAKNIYGITRDIYRYFTQAIESKIQHANTLKKQLTELDVWILHTEQKKFVPMSKVAKECHFDPSPYLYVLPKDLLQYQQLWDFVDIKETFTNADFIPILYELKNFYEDTPLPSNLLTLALDVAKAISKQRTDVPQSLPVPSTLNTLIPTSELGLFRNCIAVTLLVYNDMDWTSHSTHNLVHKSITLDVATKLGVKKVNSIVCCLT
jgi:hypothetical protein